MSKPNQTKRIVQELVGVPLATCSFPFMFGAQPLAKPSASVCFHCTVSLADRTQAEVVGPSDDLSVELFYQLLGRLLSLASSDRVYGQHLSELAEAGPVWIVDTPANRSVAQEIWAARPNRSHLEGVTMFKVPDGTSPEDMLINELDTIDLHHGTYSANPPYMVLDAIGTAITTRLKAELGEFGFNDFQETTQGFSAVRPILDDPA